MKVGTAIRLGALAFNVARDERVQELFKIAHNGVKRRGFLDFQQPPQFPGYTPYRRWPK